MINEIIRGFNNYSRALSLMSKLKLWKYVVLTGILSLIFGGGIIIISMAMIEAFSVSIINLYPFDWGSGYVVSIAKFISALSIGILGLLIYKYLVFILFVPFLGPISEKVEEHLTGVKSGYSMFNITRLIKDIFRGLRITIRILTKEIKWLILLFIVSFIPLISPFVPIFAFLISAFYAGYGNIDWALERTHNVRERITFVRDNKGMTLGNGIPFTLLLWIPVIGWFLAPALSVAAATISVVERD